MASDEAWRRECARRVLLDHLGIMPLVSRFDAIGAKAAVRQFEPTVSFEVATVSKAQMATADRPGDGLRQRLSTDHAMPIQEAPAGRDADRRKSPSLSPQGTSTQAGPKTQSSASEAPLSLLMAITGDVLWIETLEDQLLRPRTTAANRVRWRVRSEDPTSALCTNSLTGRRGLGPRYPLTRGD